VTDQVAIDVRVGTPEQLETVPVYHVLGVDPGFAFLGLAVLELTRSSMRTAHRETFETDTAMGDDASRLNTIARKLEAIFEQWGPDLCAVGFEDQSGVAARTAQTGRGISASARRVLEVQGMIRLAAVAHGFEPWCIAPSTLKLAILGKGGGRAKKAELKTRIQRIFRWRTCSEHEVDAAGAGLAAYRKHLDHVAANRRTHALIK